MARKQWPTILLVLLGIILLTTLVHSNCPKNQICDCTDDYVNCTCLHRESITFNEENEEDAFSGKEFVVNGCGKIILKKLSLKDLDIESVYISDLLELQIESFAFYEGIITNIHIANIKKFELETQGFSNIKNITNLTIRNVTLRKLESSIFSDTTIPHLIIKDSQIESVEARSLHMDNCESITIENNTIRNIEVSAIRISNASRFSFDRNSVQSTQGDSFAFLSVKEVDFGYCRFHKIATSMILAKEIGSFSFHDNYIRTCEEMAFRGVRQAKQVNFVRNQILVAKMDSLIPNYNQNGQSFTAITNEDNELGCDCNIEWLLSLNDEKYDFIKEKNVCHHPQNLRGMSLSLLQINMDKDGNCSSIEISTTTEVPVTTIPTTTETEVEAIMNEPTVASTKDNIAHSAHYNNEGPTNDQHASCEDKHKTLPSSGNKYQWNTILLFAFVIIIISPFNI